MSTHMSDAVGPDIKQTSPRQLTCNKQSLPIERMCE